MRTGSLYLGKRPLYPPLPSSCYGGNRQLTSTAWRHLSPAALNTSYFLSWASPGLGHSTSPTLTHAQRWKYKGVNAPRGDTWPTGSRGWCINPSSSDVQGVDSQVFYPTPQRAPRGPLPHSSTVLAAWRCTLGLAFPPSLLYSFQSLIPVPEDNILK